MKIKLILCSILLLITGCIRASEQQAGPSEVDPRANWSQPWRESYGHWLALYKIIMDKDNQAGQALLQCPDGNSLRIFLEEVLSETDEKEFKKHAPQFVYFSRFFLERGCQVESELAQRQYNGKANGPSFR